MMPPPIPPNRPNPPPPGGGDNGDNSTAGKTPVAYRTRSTRSQVGSANLNKSGSHQPPGSRSIGAFANAGGDPPPTASTRSIGAFANVGAPPKAMTVGKMPPPTSAASASTTGSASSLSAGVDDAIAKRRAELRRLQQNRGTGISSAMSSANRTTGGMGGSLSTMSAARSRLGGSVGSGGGSGIGGGGRPGGRGVAATAALLNNPTASTPLASFAGGTPSTAGITRRLDPALAATATASHSTPASASHRPPPQFRQITPASNMTNMVAEQQKPPKPTLLSSNMKRTSEIFNVGKQQQQYAQKYTGTTSAAASAPATKTKSVPAALNPFSPSGPPRQQPPPRQSGVPVRADNNAAAAKLKQAQETLAYPHIVSSPRKDDKLNMNSNGSGVGSGSPPKSPFGQARVITEPAMPPGKPPIMVPPLMMEPAASETVPKTTMPMNMMQAPKQPTMASMGRPAKMMIETKPKQQEAAKSKDTVISSGISTPITSNVHSNSTTTAIANASEGAESKSKDGQNKLVEGSKDGKGVNTFTAKEGISPNDKTLASSTSTSSPEMSRLMTDLQRTEQEKKEALVQVNTLKSMLEQYEKQKNMGQHNKQQLPPLSASNTTPGGLLDQLKLKVSDRGEKAAIAWIERQLEAAKDEDQSPLSSLGSNNRGRGRGEPQGTVMGEDLLSSVLPPLTPRSRPGSRAASPERGGGGGLLMSQSLGQAMDKLGGGHSARGKRMTTPLPKQLNKGNEGEGSNGSARDSVEHEYLVAAAKSIPNEYGTQLASYFVRQPYLHTEVSENDDDNNKWTCYSHLSSEERYHQLATTFDPNSLEILACVEADGSVFTLTGKSDARHGKVPSVGTGSFEEQQMDASAIVAARGEDELDWAIFDDVEEMHRALGRVTYIDVEGNEREYWLDSLYEEALATRESYCMSMISAAFALKTVQPTMQQRPLQTSPPMVQPIQSNVSPPAHFMQTSPQNATPGFVNVQQQQQPSPMYPSQPTMVESPHMNQSNFAQPAPMNPMVQPGIPNLQEPKDKSQPAMQRSKPPLKPKSNLPPSEKMPSQPKPAPSQPDQKQPAAKQQPEDEEYESADSALPHMVISLFSLLLSMILIFAKIPFRIGSMLFKLWVVIVVLKVLWLFFADDNGAWEMGAGVDYEYNMPGIY